MKYVVLNQCMIAGKAAKAGDIVEPSAQDTQTLLSMGYIGEYTEKKEPKTVNRAEALETSDEKPKKRSKKAK